MAAAARAQQLKMATVGILVTGSTNPEAFFQGIRAALGAAGLIEGQNIQLEVRSAEGSDTLLPQKATGSPQGRRDHRRPDAGGAGGEACDERHSNRDGGGRRSGPTGLISSLARPGGNITGVSGAAVETAGKKLELIRELVPWVRRSPWSPTSPILSVCPSLRSSARARAASAWRSNQSWSGRVLRKRRPSKR